MVRTFLLPTTGVALLTLLTFCPGRAAGEVVITRVGNPTWDVTDVHLFSAPAEPGPVGLATVNAILAPYFRVEGGPIIPVPPDPGPYTNEIATGLARLGIPDRSTFTPQDLAGTPNGIWLAYMLVPGPGSPIGSSPDYASGPIIPESTFPIVAMAEVLRDSAPFDTALVTSRALSTLGFDVEGSSHRPQLVETDLLNADNPLGLGVADLPGQYQFNVRLRDAQGNGYDISAAFVVASPAAVPEPSSLALLAVGGAALGLAGSGWRRRGSGRR